MSGDGNPTPVAIVALGAYRQFPHSGVTGRELRILESIVANANSLLYTTVVGAGTCLALPQPFYAPETGETVGGKQAEDERENGTKGALVVVHVTPVTIDLVIVIIIGIIVIAVAAAIAPKAAVATKNGNGIMRYLPSAKNPLLMKGTPAIVALDEESIVMTKPKTASVVELSP